LQAHGWVAMDPADVTKVMRHETAEGRVDSYTPAEMGYSIRAVEVTA
jgi:hypothetical protein